VGGGVFGNLMIIGVETMILMMMILTQQKNLKERREAGEGEDNFNCCILFCFMYFTYMH